MDSKVHAVHYRWKDQPSESMKGTITRRIVTGERLMFGEIRFKKGDTVPRHAHNNEQFTYVVEGALKFWFGDDGKQEVVVSAGRRRRYPVESAASGGGFARHGGIRHFQPTAPGLAGQDRFISARWRAALAKWHWHDALNLHDLKAF